METKLHQWFLLVNSYGFYVKIRNRFYSYRFHVYVTFLQYTWKRIRENFHVYVIFYVTYVNYLRYVKVKITSYWLNLNKQIRFVDGHYIYVGLTAQRRRRVDTSLPRCDINTTQRNGTHQLTLSRCFDCYLTLFIRNIVMVWSQTSKMGEDLSG